jgi:hypothetical protein
VLPAENSSLLRHKMQTPDTTVHIVSVFLHQNMTSSSAHKIPPLLFFVFMLQISLNVYQLKATYVFLCSDLCSFLSVSSYI